MKNKKLVIKFILLAAVIVCLSVGYYFFSYSNNYIVTDNAKVTAKMYTITPSSAGKLLEWNVRTGDLVAQDEVLGRTQTLPYITSPIKGTVVQSNVTVNQTVSPSTQLAVIADTDNMYIGVNIEETKLTRISAGQKVDVQIDAYPSSTFKGKITEIGSTTQTFFSGTSGFTTSGTYTKVTQNIPIKVEIENSDNLPMAFGMNATVKIHVK